MSSKHPHPDTAPLVVHDHWVVQARGRLFTRRWSRNSPADAPAIVLLHDSLGSVDLWRDFPAALCRATGRDVIAYDRLGFGRSDARADRPALGFVAEEAAAYFPAVREQLGLDRFVAFGHSVGGGMAIEVAARFGDACEALITESAQVFAEDRTLDGIRAAKLTFADEAQVARLARYHGDKARWVLDAWIGNWLDPAFAAWSLVDTLPRVACPVLAMHGSDDEYGTTRHAELVARRCAGPAQREILDGIGHVPHRECMDGVLELVTRFLAPGGRGA